MANRRILVTGAAGNLGQDLLSRLALFGQFETVGTTAAQLNLAWDAPQIHQVLDEIRPDVIVNTAAFTHVDGAETQFELACQVNARGPEALAQWAAQHGTYLVHISTDYVFEGTKGSPYNPQDPTGPVNRYGESKLAGEQAVLQVLSDGAVVLRTSWLYGPGSKNFVPFVVKAALAQSPVRIADDQWGTPTWTGSLCRMILEVIESRPVGVLHGTATGVVSRYDQARFIGQCLGVATDFMTPVPTAAFNFPARRPENTAMNSSFKSAPDWQTATQKYLEIQGLLKTHV